MISQQTLFAFTLLNMSFALIPGPDVMCILGNAITRGARAGRLVCLGIASACLLHVAAASLGLSVILLAVPTAFAVVKGVGALYLLYLGWQMLRHPVAVDAQAPASRWRSPFVQGALSNLLNPKIALFFLAILPQFVQPQNGHPAMQALVLGLVSIVSGTCINLLTAHFGARARGWFLARQRAFQRFQQASGAALIGLGLRVAMERGK
jgi:threonine/homoserine/homoserine lactone efflux protein